MLCAASIRCNPCGLMLRRASKLLSCAARCNRTVAARFPHSRCDATASRWGPMLAARTASGCISAVLVLMLRAASHRIDAMLSDRIPVASCHAPGEHSSEASQTAWLLLHPSRCSRQRGPAGFCIASQRISAQHRLAGRLRCSMQASLQEHRSSRSYGVSYPATLTESFTDFVSLGILALGICKMQRCRKSLFIRRICMIYL